MALLFPFVDRAGIVFEADYGTAGSGMVAVGGTASGPVAPTGSWAGSNAIAQSPSMGQHGFLHVDVTSSATVGAYNPVTFTPADAAHSLAAITTGTAGGNLLLNGGLDLFFRTASEPGDDVNNWFRPLDADNRSNGGLRIILLNKPGSPNAQVELQVVATPSNAFTASGTQTNAVISGNVATLTYTGAAFSLTNPAVSHLGVTFSTNPSTHVVTVSLFGVNASAAIDTTASTQLLARANFTITTNATTLTTGFGSGAFAFPTCYPTSASAAYQTDFDCFRIYGGAVPASLAGLPTVYSLTDFDPLCSGNSPTYNCRSGFQAAFAAIAASGAPAVLQLPPGTLLVDPGTVGSNASNLLVVPPSTTIQGTVGGDGLPATQVLWFQTDTPIFIFDRASYSEMCGIEARFTGTLPQDAGYKYPLGDIPLLRALGYAVQFPHQNQMSGTNSEMFSFIYIFDSEHVSIHDIVFDSATEDNDHCFNIGINLKGKGVVTGAAGGLTDLASGNQLYNLQFYDFVTGILASGQDSLLISDIVGDRRGTTPCTDVAPGHLLYVSWQIVFSPVAPQNPVDHTVPSTNMTVQNLTEYGDIDGFLPDRTGATVAYKNVQDSTVTNVVSHHPGGLFATLYALQNVAISHSTWECLDPLPDGAAPWVISCTADNPNDHVLPMENDTYTDILIHSAVTPVYPAMLMGDNLTVSGLTVTAPPLYVYGQSPTNPAAMVGAKWSHGSNITFDYYPVLSSFSTGTKYNRPFVGWGLATDGTLTQCTANVTIHWPSGVAQPPAGNNVITSVFQDPGDGNTVTTTFLQQ